ncbi:MAG: pirin family protein [Calditrichaeota bacterium]|nr:pirin family protein [Calditrichota bacterium]
MKTIRDIDQIINGMPVSDGAGVKLYRILGTPQMELIDPFLMLDEFRSDQADDYIAGFPNHPHRGFETVTYMKKGCFRHRDSKGNEGLLSEGGVQWMTAGKGIIHSEMPEMKDGLLWGYQLWLNLPAELKMVEAKYKDIQPEDMAVIEKEDSKIIIISGELDANQGPADNYFPVQYYDVEINANGRLDLPMANHLNGFIFVYDGDLFSGPNQAHIKRGELATHKTGDYLQLKAGGSGTGFLFLAAEPIREPVARGGPFVMNTRQEVMQAFYDMHNGLIG